MKRTMIFLCCMMAVMLTGAVCFAGTVIRDLPGQLECTIGQKAEFGLTLDIPDGTDLTGASLMLEEVISGQGSDELLGTLAFVSVNGQAIDGETDFLGMDEYPVTGSVQLRASYLLPSAPAGTVSLKVILYDENFDEIDSAKIRCIIPETVEETPLTIRGLPIKTILMVLAVLNIAVWGTVILRAVVRR